MQGRSRMAALTLVAGTALTLATEGVAVDKVVVSEVRLELAIAGLTAERLRCRGQARTRGL